MPFDPDAYLAEKEGAASAKPFDPDAYLASKESAAAKGPSWYDRLARQAGLTVRGAVGGLASTLDVPNAVLSQTTKSLNQIAGTNIPVITPDPMRQSYEHLFDAAGVARPETPMERVSQQAVAGMTGALGSASMASHLANAATTPLAKAVLTQIGESPSLQAKSGAAAGGAGQVVAEMGGGPVPQTMAALVAGTSPMAGIGARNLVRSEAAEEGTRLAQVQKNAAEAHEAGYVVPPSQISPTRTNDTLGGWAGKKIEQKASIANQDTTNRLAKEDLGLPADAVLDEKTLADVRKTAGAAYKKITEAKTPVPIDKTFEEKIKSLAGTGSYKADIQGKSPELDRIVNLLTEAKMKPSESMSANLGMPVPTKPEFSTTQIIEYVKELRKQATANLKSIGDNAAKNQTVGLAQREAADALDDLLERNLQHMHLNKNEVAEYKDARRMIAKAHDYENITNTTTGNVSARLASRLADKGAPLTGNFEKIAKFGAAFPKSAQNVDMLGNVTDASALDWGLALTTLGHGRPDVAGAILGRPVARNALLSKPYQNAVFTPKETAPVAGMAVPLSQLMQGVQQ